MKKLCLSITIFISILFSVTQIVYAVDIEIKPLSNVVGPGGFKVKYNSSAKIINQRMNKILIPSNLMIDEKYLDGRMCYTKNRKGKFICIPNDDGYIKQIVISYKYDDVQFSNNLYIMLLNTLSTLDYIYDMTSLNESIKGLELYNTSEEEGAYILDNKDPFDKKIYAIKFDKGYDAPNNEVTILIYKVVLSGFNE